MKTKDINKAIKHLGVQIVRGRGYQYFIDLDTEDQIGESVYVCYLNHLSLEEWVERAQMARSEHSN
jgi:hypothetical protein